VIRRALACIDGKPPAGLATAAISENPVSVQISSSLAKLGGQPGKAVAEAAQRLLL
jgi:hypothetical protein